MDDETPLQSDEPSKRPLDPLAQQAEHVHVHQELQRKFSHAGDAQILSEETVGMPKRRAVRRLLYGIGGCIVIGVIVSVGIRMVVMPRMVFALPSLIKAPYATLSGYKRVVSGYVDYYPSLVQSARKTGISEFDHGASFSVLSSADILPHKGLEGVLRLDIEKTKSPEGASDIDIGYKVLFSGDQDDVGIYFFFNQWPDFLQALGITGESRGVWFGYDSKQEQTTPENVRDIVSVFNPEKNRDGMQRFISYLWHRAAKDSALRWKLETMARKNDEGKYVADILVALDADAFMRSIETVSKDPLFTPEMQSIADVPIAGTTVMDFLRSVRSLNGLVTVGLHDRLVHEATWTFDINDPKAGTYRGSLTTTLTPVAVKKEILRPETAESALDILTLFLAEEPNAGEVGESAIDSDSDGLSDEEESRYATDPLLPDSDGDGYLDGDEVRAGYNPKGSGKLPSNQNR